MTNIIMLIIGHAIGCIIGTSIVLGIGKLILDYKYCQWEKYFQEKCKRENDIMIKVAKIIGSNETQKSNYPRLP